MKPFYQFNRHVWLTCIIVVCSLNYLFGQINTPTLVCPNVQVTYPSGYASPSHQVYGYPVQASYPDGTPVSQYSDGSQNLIVTWPKAGAATVIYVFADGETLEQETINVNVGSQPVFTVSPAVVCNSQTSTFTISDSCGTSYVWAAPTGWSINGGSNTLTTSSKSVNITAPSTGTGSAQITVTSNNNYAGSVSANVWKGKPNTPGGLTVTSGSFSNMCINSQVSVIISAVPGATSYTWTSNNPTGLRVEGSGTSALITGLASSTSSPNGYWTFTYAANNQCGSSSQLYGVVIGNCGGGGGGHQNLVVSPNPASSTLTIQVTDSSSSSDRETADQSYDFHLINKYSQTVYSIRSSDKNIQIPLEELPNDVYYLKVKYKDREEVRRIIVKH